MFIETDP